MNPVFRKIQTSWQKLTISYRFQEISEAGRARLLNVALSRVILGFKLITLVNIPFVLWLKQLDLPYKHLLLWALVCIGNAAITHGIYRLYQNDRRELTDGQLLIKWLPRLHWLASLYGLVVAMPLWLITGYAPFEVLILYLVTMASIMSGNANHQSAVLTAFTGFFLGSWIIPILFLPWILPDFWQFTMPLASLHMFSTYKDARQSQHFYLQQILMEENGIHLAENFRQAKEQAEQALQAKNQFLSTASHDLRQPVHAMSFLIESISIRNRDPGLISALSDLQQSVHSITRMFNSLLDLSKIEMGAMQVQLTSLPLDKLMQDVAIIFREEAKSRGIDLRVRLTGNNAWVHADSMLVHQSLINLMQNALRYTRLGGILLTARKRDQDWQIEVWDTGVGIAVQDSAKIFSPFFRNQHAWDIDNAGHGLGLAVVARCANLMNAAYGFNSREGKGSRFWMKLPAAPASDTITRHSRQPDFIFKSSPAIMQGCCLIIDDDPQVCTAWQALLTSWGLQVAYVHSGQEALLLADSGFLPQAILCDQRLRSAESGFEVLCALLERWPHAYGAMVSGEFHSPELAQAETEGFLVLHKPVDPEHLRLLLSQWFAPD